MKILVVSRFFWPVTTPLATRLPSIVRRWIDDGHEVTVLTGWEINQKKPADCIHPKLLGVSGFSVLPVPLLPEKEEQFVVRVINMVLFIAGIFHYVFWSSRFQVIMTTTFPPVLIGWASRLSAGLTDAAFIYHCEDVYPEVGRMSGLISNKFLYRTLLAIDRKTCEKSAAVVVLSEDMQKTIEKRGLRRQVNFQVINNFNLPPVEPSPALPPELEKTEGRFRVLFAGNIGMFQGLDSVLDAAAMLKEYKDIEFLFLGEGLAKPGLMEKGRDLLGQTVFFFPRQPVAVAEKVMATADLGLITLNRDIYKFAYPSKTMSYLERGCPVLVAVEPESELSRFVARERIGFHAPPGDAQALKEKILEAYEKKSEAEPMRQRAKEVARNLFAEDAVMDRWSQMLEDLLKNRAQENGRCE